MQPTPNFGFLEEHSLGFWRKKGQHASRRQHGTLAQRNRLHLPEKHQRDNEGQGSTA